MGRAEDKRKPTPEETEAVAEPQEVPEGATDEETLGATFKFHKKVKIKIQN
jgi:hypothetical protein